jgi:hypothetical protein
MLSKAEILYLQGQKQVSQSYERKLKCLIRKKLEVLQREIPLLSKLLRNEVSSFADISKTTELGTHCAKNNTWLNEINQPVRLNNRATEFSNAESNGIEIDIGKDIKSQNSEGFTHLIMDNSTPATEFSNGECDGATKYSNSHDIHNIRSKPTNPSTNKPITRENLNKSSKNDLISIWAGSDSNQRPPPCQGGILTRLDHRPLYYNY